MIVHATAKAIQQCRLKTYDKLKPANLPLAKSILARDLGSGLHEWGMNCFDFLGKRCLVFVNNASHFTLFTYGAKYDQMNDLGNFIARSLFDSYTGDTEMIESLHRMFEYGDKLIFKPLQNRNLSAILNHMIVDYARCGNRFRDYVDYNNVLHLKQINYDVNFNYSVSHRIDGKNVHIEAGPYFRKLVVTHYGNKQNL